MLIPDWFIAFSASAASIPYASYVFKRYEPSSANSSGQMAKNNTYPSIVRMTGANIANNNHLIFPFSLGFQPMCLMSAFEMTAAISGINIHTASPA